MHVGIYKKTMKSKKNQLEKDYLATQAIPFLLPLAMEPTLNAKQVRDNRINQLYSPWNHQKAYGFPMICGIKVN